MSLLTFSQMLPAFQPLPVIRKPQPFDHEDWLFELKYDGFRALAYLERGNGRLVSRNGHQFASYAALASSLGGLAGVTNAILDGEIVCIDYRGRPQFNNLLFRRKDPCFYAFDLLYLNGRDYRSEPLAERKAVLKRLLTSSGNPAMVYVDHVERSGIWLYRRVCELDLEGIVAKHRAAAYISENRLGTWYKIRNPRYSQMIGRHVLFERERHREPVPGWHTCDLACANI